MTYINALHLVPNIEQIDPFSPPWKYSLCMYYIDSNSIPNHGNSIPLPPSFAVSMDGNFHAFPWLGDYYLIFDSICAWHTTLIYHIWTIPRSRLISWLRRKVKIGQLTWCEGQGWAWHTPLISIYARKWALWRSRLITWPPCLSALYPQSGLKCWRRSTPNLC